MTKTPRTANGWAVEPPNSPRLVNIYTHSDTKYARPFKVKRTVAPAFQHLIDFLDGIEPAEQQGWDGGHAYRVKNLASGTAGPDDWSEHAAGTAIDWNASQHLQNRGRYEGWSTAQVTYLDRFLISTLGAPFDWGSRWWKSPDPMHFEIKDAERWAKVWVHLKWPEPRFRPATRKETRRAR